MSNGGFVTSINLSWSYLGVTAEGTFDFLTAAANDYAAPTWMMPNTLITRPASVSMVFPGGGRLFLRDTTNWAGGALISTDVVPAAHPGSYTGAVESSTPAVLRDGTIIWFPTDRTMMAVCPDGRSRWVLEFYNDGYAPTVFAAGDGNIVLAGAPQIGFHRIDPDGHLLATRDMSDAEGSVLGYSDRCGLALQTSAPLGLQYFAGADFSIVSEIEGYATPTADCGWWSISGAAGQIRSRHRPDGGIGFVSTARQPSLALLELADGSWLIVSRGGPEPPGMSVVTDTGTVVFDSDFDPRVVGDSLNEGAYLLTPGGVLYVTATSELETVQQFAAIEVGMGPADGWIGRGGLGFVGSNWANDMATWHARPAP
jgi:hypothetical protein